jgi:hypothetical protein
MRVHKSHFERLRLVLAASVVALLAATPALVADGAKPATAGFVPTADDYLAIYDAMQRYRFGVEKQDKQSLNSAFWDAPKSSGHPPGEEAADVWHLPLDSYIHFESATRATNFTYFLTIYPQPEKKGEGIPNSQARMSIVGWPGHYEDVFEKRKGEWRILQHRTRINEEK